MDIAGYEKVLGVVWYNGVKWEVDCTYECGNITVYNLVNSGSYLRCIKEFLTKSVYTPTLP